MKTVRIKFFGLWLVAGAIAANAQLPPPPAEGPALARPTNVVGTPTNPFLSRSTNFGRFLRTNAPGATNPIARTTNAAAAAAAVAAPVVPPTFAPAVPGANAAVPGPGPGGPTFPAGPGRPGPAPLLASGASTNFAATNIVPRGSTNIPANMMRFQEADLSQIFELYSELTGRTILKSPQVPQNVKISVRNQTALTREEGIDALNTILGLNQITMVYEGDKFVKAIPQAGFPQEAAQFSTNSSEYLHESKFPVAQIVQLKNLAPEEALGILQPFAQLPNSIIGVKGSPVLILRDYSENVKRMLEILERVDVQMPLDIETVVIPIKYALAGEIAGVLSGLGASTGSGLAGGGGSSGGGLGGGGGFGAGGTGAGINRLGQGSTLGGGYGGGAYGAGGTYPGTTGGAYGTGARPFGTTAGGLGTSGAGGFGGGARGGTFGGRLGGAVQRAVGTQGAGAAAGEFALIGQAKIIPDERSNALLIFADRPSLAMISNIIAKLDVVLPQVLIEALIMEVNLGDGKSLGVTMSQNRQKAGDLTYAGISPNGPSFLDPRNLTSIGSFATNGSSAGGLSYFGKLNDDFDIAVNAAATDSRINVLSRPRIQTSTAKHANIFVGETRPYVTGSYFSDFGGGGSRSQVAQAQIGIGLDVFPIINQEGLVVMDISQDISQVGGTVKVDNNDVPITINRTATAYVAVHDRDTILLGGFISTTKNKSNSGVPYLKDIPFLGLLFRSSSENVSRVELMVLIRPTVLPTPEAAALDAAVQRDRSPEIKRLEREEQEFYNKQLEKERKAEEKFERRIK